MILLGLKGDGYKNDKSNIAVFINYQISFLLFYKYCIEYIYREKPGLQMGSMRATST